MFRIIQSITAVVLLVISSSCANRVSVNNAFERLFAKSPEFATPLSNAEAAWEKIRSDRATPADIASYNVAVTNLMTRLDLSTFTEGASGAEKVIVEPPLAPVKIAFADHRTGDSDFAPGDFDSLVAADFLKIRGIRSQVYQFGVGAPMVGRLADERESEFTPKSGAHYPVTAIVEFEGDGSYATIRLLDPLKDGEEVIAAEERKLEANFTAPIASSLAARERQRLNLPAMVNFEKFKHELGGLTQIEPVYPAKIPVVFIHGLKSNPDTWRDVLNELRDYPEIRDRYEFWMFGYATGAPIPYTARRLRLDLQQMRTFRDFQGADTDDVILVGHSMGGILSRLMTQHGGDEEWFRIFNTPVDELEVSDEDREMLREIAYFEPLPYVRRVIFISTPHRGSEIPENFVGKLGSALIELPANVISLSGGLLRDSFAALTPEGREYLSQIPNSIEELSATSTFMKEQRNRPLSDEVIYHSIIGDRGRPGPREESSDGVVPYWSSHRDEAVSELMVPAGHGAHQHPEAIAEIARILLSH